MATPDNILIDFLDSDSEPQSDPNKDELVALLTSDSGYEALLKYMLLPAPPPPPVSSSSSSTDDDDDDRQLSMDELKRSFRVMSILNYNLNGDIGTNGMQNNTRNITDIDGMENQIGNNNGIMDASYGGPAVYKNIEIDKARILDGHLILDHDTAGLVAKKIFQAHGGPSREFRSHNPHLQKVLMTLMSSFPSSVISAAVAGGPSAVDRNLSPLLDSDMSLLISLVSLGCRDKPPQEKKHPMNMRSPTPTNNHSQPPLIKKGNRRKFVRSLIEWRLLERLIDCIVCSDADKNKLDSESACDALFQIVKNINAPDSTAPDPNSNNATAEEAPFGEDKLMCALGKEDQVRKLLVCALEEPLTSQGIAASRALTKIFILATGRKQKKTPTKPSTAENNNNTGNNSCGGNNQANNRLSKWGVTKSMFLSLCHNVSILGKGIMTPALSFNDGVIPPFTSRRHYLITVLADMLEFSGSVDDFKSEELLNGICETISESSIQFKENSRSTPDTTHLLPYLTCLVFLYEENTLFHVQYYRIFLSILRSNHEPSLRLLIQKSKFVSKAITVYTKKGGRAKSSLRGIVLMCLNALRLQRQCLEPKVYLEHYLDSHDIWKGFQQQLLSDTSQEQLPGLGLMVPLPNGSLSTVNSDFDLGSEYANRLGFAGAEKYVLSEAVAPLENSEAAQEAIFTAAAGGGGGGRKKKKGKKKKKK